MSYAELTHTFLLVCIAALGVMEIFCLIRTILGPRISDRIVGINMIGTQVIISAALVALLVLAAYLLFINREERRYFADSVKDLFRRR